MYFYDLDNWDQPSCSKEREVVHYCTESYKRMLKLLKILFRLLDKDMKAELNKLQRRRQNNAS